ncbi:hypothetical protein [Actinomyces gaoshouyii]|uniref:hypothetical protein n=1 Tax=Actinomyces gaoshouyii TaxID=1960083 RepID=UPI0009BDAE10|nr:hypothetical protein [Actinomyces gaoshouyii]ARD42486.1 hypothetical protein B6G06_09160 [Actinomyces gaoshouyii]
MTRHVTTRQRTSRGKVRCNHCGRTIAKGTSYDEEHLVDMGTIYTLRCCPACVAAFLWAQDPHIEEDIDLHEWSGDLLSLDSYYTPYTLFHELSAPAVRDRHDYIASLYRQLGEAATQAEEWDRTDPDPETVAAFIWRMRTSPAMHPQGVKE